MRSLMQYHCISIASADRVTGSLSKYFVLLIKIYLRICQKNQRASVIFICINNLSRYIQLASLLQVLVRHSPPLLEKCIEGSPVARRRRGVSEWQSLGAVCSDVAVSLTHEMRPSSCNDIQLERRRRIPARSTTRRCRRRGVVVVRLR